MPKFEEVKKIEEVYPNIDYIEHGDLINLQNDIKSMWMDGKLVIQGKDGELLGYEAMYESIFVNNWIAQFAIDEVNGKRYFNMQSWSEVTDKLTKGVIVVEDGTDIPMFIIPSFIRPKLTNEEGSTLSYYSNKASAAKHITDKYEQTQFINGFAKRVGEIIKDGTVESGLTSLIPNWVYHRHGIVPMAMKAMVYIRDTYQPEMDDETFNKAEDILKRYYTGQKVTDLEKKLILDLTNNEFSFASVIVDEDNKINNNEVSNKVEDEESEEESFFED